MVVAPLLTIVRVKVYVLQVFPAKTVTVWLVVPEVIDPFPEIDQV